MGPLIRQGVCKRAGPVDIEIGCMECRCAVWTTALPPQAALRSRLGWRGGSALEASRATSTLHGAEERCARLYTFRCSVCECTQCLTGCVGVVVLWVSACLSSSGL